MSRQPRLRSATPPLARAVAVRLDPGPVALHAVEPQAVLRGERLTAALAEPLEVEDVLAPVGVAHLDDHRLPLSPLVHLALLVLEELHVLARRLAAAVLHVREQEPLDVLSLPRQHQN